MPRLEGPYEILEMKDGEEVTLKITSWQEGYMYITPRFPESNGEKRIPVLRVLVTPETKETLPPYWDVTSKHLIAGLKAYLTRPGYRDKTFRIRKIGVRPTARFTLTVS